MTASPNVVQSCTPTTVSSAVSGLPSQSLVGRCSLSRNELNGPSALSTVLNIVPMITGDSTTGKKYTAR